MLGYADDEIFHHVSEWEKIVNPDDLPSVWTAVSDHLEGKTENYSTVHRVRCKDGGWKWILDRGMVFERDGDGRPVRMVGTHTDITEQVMMKESLKELNATLERKVAERTAELAASEERFRLLFEQHGAVMLVIDPESGAILDANPAAAAFYGYSRNDLRGMTIDRINCLPPEEVSDLRNVALKGVQSRFVMPHRLADGTVRTVEVHASPITRDGTTLLFSLVTDITAQRELDQNLTRLSEASEQGRLRLKAIMDSLLDPHVLLNAVRDDAGKIVDFVFADANEAACEVNRLPWERLVGLPLLGQHPAAETTDLFGRYVKVVESGEPLILDDWSYPQDMLGGEVRQYR